MKKEKYISRVEWSKCRMKLYQACKPVAELIQIGEELIPNTMGGTAKSNTSNWRKNLESSVIQELYTCRSVCPAYNACSNSERANLPCTVAAQEFKGVLSGIVYKGGE